MTNSNYPSGMGRRDKIRAGIIQPHAHEHESGPVERESPIIEDGAAIFYQKCIYAEGPHGQGYECKEEHSYRFEYDELESPNGQQWDLPTIHEWEDNKLPLSIEEMVITIEEEFQVGNSEIVDIDPDPKMGHVTIEHGGWKLYYSKQ